MYVEMDSDNSDLQCTGYGEGREAVDMRQEVFERGERLCRTKIVLSDRSRLLHRRQDLDIGNLAIYRQS